MNHTRTLLVFAFICMMLAFTTIKISEATVARKATISVGSIAIPSYPYHDYLVDGFNPTYNLTFKRLDWNRYDSAPKTLVPRTFTAIFMENEYLRLVILPELGGRIYECTFKPTGNNEFYRNPVLKPTHWGPPEQGWWLAAGGMEWGLPVEEHGYESALPWEYRTEEAAEGIKAIVQDTAANDRLRARVEILLPHDRAYFIVHPRIENPTGAALNYKFWLNAMLAPGAANKVSDQLQFIFPVNQITVHSRDDRWNLPGPGGAVDWPLYKGQDLSFLGNWPYYLGFFERPSAQRGFMGVYDHRAGEGMVRVYPHEIARGAKGFAFGYGAGALPPTLWTDDDSSYVELHGGVAPTFDDYAALGPGEALSWSEYWYPVAQIGGFLYANSEAALNIGLAGGRATLSIASTARHENSQVFLRKRADGALLFRETISVLSPSQPYRSAPLPVGALSLADLSLTCTDATGNVLAAYNPIEGEIPTPSPPTAFPTPTLTPTASPSPPPAEEWAAQVIQNTTDPKARPNPIILLVTVDGLAGTPIRVYAGSWSTINYTGTKPEYGPYFCEFSPMPRGPVLVVAEKLNVSLEVVLHGPGVAIVRFYRRPRPEPTATPTSYPTTLTPSPPTAFPTPTLTPTASPSPPPAEEWAAQVIQNTTDPKARPNPIILLVTVDGLAGTPIRVYAGSWSTINYTGTKPEYGPYFCEFSPMPRGPVLVVAEKLNVSLEVVLHGPGVAIVRFYRR
ncbi:MAG: DUF5107 domain-containing protein [Anaerolineae bacterium]